MPQAQQEFIQEAIDYLGLTKTALAIKLNTSEFTINSWLLPDSNPRYVPISDYILDKINDLVQEKKAANFFPVHDATSHPEAPGAYCDKYQFEFPTLYRTVNNGQLNYTLSDNPEGENSSQEFEPITCLQDGRDNTWVFINEHSSMNAVLGYWRVIKQSNSDSVCARFKVYLYKDHLFSIYHAKKPESALRNNIVMYQIDDNEFQIAMPSMRRREFDDWSMILDSHGGKLAKSDIWSD